MSMIKSFISKIIVFSILLFPTFSYADDENSNTLNNYLPSISIIPIDEDSCNSYLIVKNINLSDIDSASILSDGNKVENIEVLSDTYEIVVSLPVCRSKVETYILLKNGVSLSKSINLLSDQKTAQKGGRSLRYLVKKTAKTLRSNKFNNLINKIEEEYAYSRWVTNSIKRHRHGIANKLDEIATYTDINERLIGDQVTNYLRSKRITPWIAKVAGYSVRKVIWIIEEVVL